MGNLAKITGNNIRLLRSSKGLSQKKLSEMCGVTRQTLVRLENGENASLDIIEKISLSLNVPASLLLSINEVKA